ncbi:hypothetical protein AAIH09_31895, partial [Pseudomonas aeruginosa]|uniref:hypothetical protein n=1 Tax=Pseudomonas aeruginosa TaxID=287 RepID=UPI0031B6DB30
QSTINVASAAQVADVECAHQATFNFPIAVAGPPSWSVLPSVYASLFSKVWVFSAAQLPTALVPNR